MDLVLAYSRIEFSTQNIMKPQHIGASPGLPKLAISGQNGKPIRGVK
jgi:hypothetical protein